jgi:hypothetical protein
LPRLRKPADAGKFLGQKDMSVPCEKLQKRSFMVRTECRLEARRVMRKWRIKLTIGSVAEYLVEIEARDLVSALRVTGDYVCTRRGPLVGFEVNRVERKGLLLWQDQTHKLDTRTWMTA